MPEPPELDIKQNIQDFLKKIKMKKRLLKKRKKKKKKKKKMKMSQMLGIEEDFLPLKMKKRKKSLKK